MISFHYQYDGHIHKQTQFVLFQCLLPMLPSRRWRVLPYINNVSVTIAVCYFLIEQYYLKRSIPLLLYLACSYLFYTPVGTGVVEILLDW